MYIYWYYLFPFPTSHTQSYTFLEPLNIFATSVRKHGRHRACNKQHPRPDCRDCRRPCLPCLRHEPFTRDIDKQLHPKADENSRQALPIYRLVRLNQPAVAVGFRRVVRLDGVRPEQAPCDDRCRAWCEVDCGEGAVGYLSLQLRAHKCPG